MVAALAVTPRYTDVANSTGSSSRAEILARYRQLRVVGRAQHSAMMKLVSGPHMFKQARRLGLIQGKTFVLDSLGDMNFVFDLLLYTSSLDRPRAADRYARSVQLAPGSDEAIMLQAKLNSRFAILECKRRHNVVGLVMEDVVRQVEYHLVDEGLEVSLREGARIATRIAMVEDLVMALGVFVPVEGHFLRRVYDSIPQLQRKNAAAIVDDRRFAEAIYRNAILDGLTAHIAYREPDEPALDALLRLRGEGAGIAA